jgi:hypothetical protein
MKMIKYFLCGFETGWLFPGVNFCADKAVVQRGFRCGRWARRAVGA